MYAQQGLLDEAEAVVDRMNRCDVVMPTPEEAEVLMLQIDRLEAKVAAAKAKVLRQYRRDGLWATKGAQTPEAVLATERRVPSRTCRPAFTTAAKLGELPVLEAAMARGTVSLQHRNRILAVDNPRVHQALVACHDEIVAWAETLPWTAFDARLTMWLHHVDPDGPDPGEEKRGLDLSQTWRDDWVLNGRLGAVNGAIFGSELRRLADELFEEDWAEAKERLGREPTADELGRDHRQRRADALVRMAERSAVNPDEVRKGVVLLCVLMGGEAFKWLCETTTGVKVRPGQVVPHVDQVTFETFLYGEGMRDVSVSRQRCFVDALARAGFGIHRQCFHEYCDKPIAQLQSDHRFPWSKGGATTIGNHQGGCAFHNGGKGSSIPGDGPDP